MVSIPQQHACFKVQSCELRELGDETQKMLIEMKCEQKLQTFKLHIQRFGVPTRRQEWVIDFRILDTGCTPVSRK